jgi:two-component system, cell cycle sensor histidine kinase and response regulator CckA
VKNREAIAMNPHLRVLIVEDSEDDMLLSLRELDRGGYSVDSLRVDTPQAMQEALDRQPWDIVIADYTLPLFSAPAALKLLQQQNYDLPFIIVSGTIGEEMAVAAMKAGAHDYLIKGNLARLVPAVERELREAAERQKRHRAEQALRESEERYRLLFDSNPNAIFMQDLEQRILVWNKGAERLYGWNAATAVGKNALELLSLPGELPPLDKIQTALTQAGQWQGELRQVTHDGKAIAVESRWTLVRDEASHPQSILTVNTDITEKKQLEAQFLRAQRLESLGTLASGIAHDFNNILTPILAATQLLPLKLPDLGDRNLQLLHMMEVSAKRGADLIKQILAFTRGAEGKRVPLQIRHPLSEVVQVVRQTFPKNIDVSIDIPTHDLGTVAADATQLHQIFMNLCVNARDAMPNGGKLSISAANQAIDAAYTRLHLDARPGAYVRVTVSDTGTGILPELQDRIFDPFFTTKEIGKGTGLGLSTVLGIVRNHGGFIEVESQLRQGSQFHVYFPAIATPALPQPEEQPLSEGDEELILVVDDEPFILQIAQTALEEHHYKALLANNGAEAIALYTQHQPEVRAILMDMMMPSMDGFAAIRELQKINPHVPIIATSGLVSHQQTQASDIQVNAFLAKPYTAKELLEVLENVLRAARTIP